jgi:hypothetical protein
MKRYMFHEDFGFLERDDGACCLWSDVEPLIRKLDAAMKVVGAARERQKRITEQFGPCDCELSQAFREFDELEGGE